MLRVSNPARRKARKGVFSTAAMAVALAAGGIVAGMGIAVPASAQEYSDAWRNVAAPVSEAVAKTDTDETVKALVARVAAAGEAEKPALMAELNTALGGAITQLPSLVTAATTVDDKYSTGQMHLNLGNKLRDARLQMQGLKLMVDSGKAPADQVTLFNYYVGSLAWDLKDYAIARTYLTKAAELGHQADNLVRLIGETYFAQGQNREGLAVLDEWIAKRGKDIPEDTYRRALQIVYENSLSDQVVKRSADLVRYHPTEETWGTALAVILDTNDLTADESVDLFRLMRVTNSMRDARTYVDYIEAADVNRMANELLPVIQQGIDRGLLQPEDTFVKEALEVVTARAPEDRAAAEEDAALARTATDAISARAAADNYLALENFAGAEELYKLALQRAPAEADRLNMRIGVSQARQGKIAEARSTFEAVQGKRAAVAAMWLAWLDTQSAA
jgi:tetratricopeptide (TPR) repeat protein